MLFLRRTLRRRSWEKRRSPSPWPGTEVCLRALAPTCSVPAAGCLNLGVDSPLVFCPFLPFPLPWLFPPFDVVDRRLLAVDVHLDPLVQSSPHLGDLVGFHVHGGGWLRGRQEYQALSCGWVTFAIRAWCLSRRATTLTKFWELSDEG